MAAELTFYPSAPLRSGTQQGALNGNDLGTVAVAIGASATAAAAAPAGTSLIVVTTDETCRIKFGASDVAAAKTGAGLSRLLKANAEYAFAVEGGRFYSLIAAA